MDHVDGNADSMPRSPDQPMKRARVVYGKRSSNRPPPSPVVPVSEESARVHHARTVSSHRRTLSLLIHASPSERSPSPDPVDPFQFGFKHKLKELDEQFDDHDTQLSKPGSSPHTKAVRAGPSQVKDGQSVSMGTSALSSEAHRSPADPSRASLSPSSHSLRAISALEYSLEPPIVRRPTRRVPNPISSDSEVEHPSKSSSVSPVRHAITTPHSRSSPTPPTSGEIPMVSRKSKGKAPARDVLPLLFGGEPPSATEIPSKSKKGRRSEPLLRPKTKAPTKKERREAALESSRIAASRPVEVLRTQEHKHSLAAFFSSLRRNNTVTSTLGAELPSDPIERFSSPSDKSTQVKPSNSVFGAPTGLLRGVGTTNELSPSPIIKALPPAATDSEDEMPSVASIIQQAGGKQKRLQAIKQVALQHADAMKTIDSDSEADDLLIVKDDMHSVAREAAVQRRLDKASGSPTKDLTALRKINHPSIRPVAISPRKLSRHELEELAKPSFARAGKGTKGQLNKTQLDQWMITQHKEEQLKSIKRLEEQWVKGGGKLSRDTGGDDVPTSLSQKLEAYAERGLKSVEIGDADEEGTSADESDEEYTPALRGSASPEPMEEDDVPDDPENMEVSQVSRPQGGDEEEETVALKRNKHGQRCPRVILGSDDEEMPPVQRILPAVQRDSASSMESQTEDENDKENSAKLMYDRSEDKENKAIVRHESSPSGHSRVSSIGIGDGAQSGLSLAPDTDLDDATGSPKGEVRSPLKDISKDDDDFFLSPPSKSLFADRLLRSAAMSPPRTSASTLSLEPSPILRTERVDHVNQLSFDSENNEGDRSEFKIPQPSFLERLQCRNGPEPSLASFKPLPNGGFSQLFSVEDGNLKASVDRGENDGLSLTLDVGLKPALEVSDTLKLRAETIFEKEQEYVVAAAVQQNDKPKELLYVNDYGFLTQTRPEGSSPQIYRTTPSQASKFIGTQVHATQSQFLSTRPPLRTLSFTASQEVSPELQPLRRLRKRSLSPLEQKVRGQDNSPIAKLNAFSILGKAPKPLSKAQHKKPEKSEFVAVEAEESDEDDMFGFGGPKKHDDDERDDEEEDKIVEGLVDDTVMDVETEAADLVQEKFREHEEVDDQRREKLIKEVAEGKHRTKRRDRGVGFEDDSDEYDDDDESRIRERIHKKRKIEGDNLEALGQNEETRAFYDTYHQDLIDEDDEFGYLREHISMPMPPGEDDAQAEEPEEQQETVTMDEIRQRVREMAQNDHEVDALDPEDTSWVDQSMVVDAEDIVHVKVVDCQRSKPVVRHPNGAPMAFDLERPRRGAESEQERKQMASWAKNQTHQRQGTGRSGNAAAVTCHTKVKSGGGSLRSTQLSNSTAAGAVRKTKTSSLLSRVSSRSGKFA